MKNILNYIVWILWNRLTWGTALVLYLFGLMIVCENRYINAFILFFIFCIWIGLWAWVDESKQTEGEERFMKWFDKVCN